MGFNCSYCWNPCDGYDFHYFCFDCHSEEFRRRYEIIHIDIDYDNWYYTGFHKVENDIDSDGYIKTHQHDDHDRYDHDMSDIPKLESRG